jgi:hypothetical protein
MLLFFPDWSYPLREEVRHSVSVYRCLAQAMALLRLVLSLLPPYGGFNHTVLVQIFYICFHSYNFNSTQRINQSTQNMFQTRRCVYNTALHKFHMPSYDDSHLLGEIATSFFVSILIQCHLLAQWSCAVLIASYHFFQT